eukprot:5158120-Prymnesium_polylepis.1
MDASVPQMSSQRGVHSQRACGAALLAWFEQQRPVRLGISSSERPSSGGTASRPPRKKPHTQLTALTIPSSCWSNELHGMIYTRVQLRRLRAPAR